MALPKPEQPIDSTARNGASEEHPGVKDAWQPGGSAAVDLKLGRSAQVEVGLHDLQVNGHDSGTGLLRLASDNAPLRLPVPPVTVEAGTPSGAVDRTRRLGNSDIPPAELDFVRDAVPGKTDAEKAENWKAVKALFAAGQTPSSALLEAADKSQLLGVGDQHAQTGEPSGQVVELLKANMKKLAERGYTDMFVEYPQVLQPVFDAFNNDPKHGDLIVPASIPGQDGKPLTTPEAIGGLRFLSQMKADLPQIIQLWRAARDAGIHIHAVDNNLNALSRGSTAAGSEGLEEQRKQFAALDEARDRDMKANMQAVLNEPTENGAPRKGIAFLGALHVAKQRPGGMGPSAIEMLTPELNKANGAVTSFFGEDGSISGANLSSLYPLVQQVDGPIAVSTHGPNGEPKALTDVAMLRISDEKNLEGQSISLRIPLGNFDRVLLFPDESSRTFKFDQQSSSELLRRPELNTPAGEAFRSMVGNINWGEMPPEAADKGGFVDKQLLDKLWFNNGGHKPDGWNDLARSLGVPGYADRKASDVNYVVIDTRGYWEHAAKVDSSIRSGDPTATDARILNLWLPTDAPKVAPGSIPSSVKPEDRGIITEAQTYSQALQSDLDRALQFAHASIAEGGRAPDVILPQTVSPYYLGQGSPLAISPKELGVEPIQNADQATAQYKQNVLDGLKRLASSGDVRAQSVLDTLAALHNLGQTSKVYLSQNNDDKLDLGVFLGDMDKNVFSVSSINRENRPADYNAQTAQFAKALALGSVVSIPPELRKNLDMNQFSNVIVREPDASDTLAGRNTQDLLMSDDRFEKLKRDDDFFVKESRFTSLENSINLARGSWRYDHELPTDIAPLMVKESDVLQRALARAGHADALPANFAAMTDEQKQSVFESMLKDGRGRLLEHGLMLLAGDVIKDAGRLLPADQVLMAMEAESPNFPIKSVDDEMVISWSEQKWREQLENTLRNSLLTFNQARTLFHQAHPEKPERGDDAAQEMKDLLFQLDGPNMLDVKTYLPISTLQGQTVALPIEMGNSFSAPYLAARRHYEATIK
jgi:hypothetical protein